MVSGRMMMIRACPSLLIAAVMKDPCFNAGSRARHLTVCGSRLPFPTRIAKIHALNNRTRRAEPAGSAREDRELLTLELAVQHACDPQQSSSKQSESAGFRHNFDVAVSAGKHDRAVKGSFGGIDRQLHGHTVGGYALQRTCDHARQGVVVGAVR